MVLYGNNYFECDEMNPNLFSHALGDEMTRWRIWEDDSNVTFLAPFGTTPGYTLLVPRKRLGSDVFSLGEEEFTILAMAAHPVSQHLKAAFGVKRCGMVFDAYEIDYAHVQLVSYTRPTACQWSIFYCSPRASSTSKLLRRISHFWTWATRFVHERIV